MANDLILITGAGGFIGGHLAKYFNTKGKRVRCVDKKLLGEWHQLIPGTQQITADVSIPYVCEEVVKGVSEVYNLAANMGGMGFITKYRIECMRSVLINTNLIEAAKKAGVPRYFFSSSACVYNTQLLEDEENPKALKESDAYPAFSERGYGWEKLFSEMLCQEYWYECHLPTFIARFHNTYGPYGTWYGGREKAPAAICRKVIEAIYHDIGKIEIWGDGRATRTYTYIDDLVQGIDKIMHCNKLVATPINLGSSECISVNQLVDIVEDIADIKLERIYIPGPRGSGGRGTDNTLIKQTLDWEPAIPIREGLTKTYMWIEEEYRKLHGKS
jgi:nucleoside-diphosphate-sugar epimerase